MKAIYLETFAGISGNMLLGALLDAGFPIDVLKEELGENTEVIQEALGLLGTMVELVGGETTVNARNYKSTIITDNIIKNIFKKRNC